MSINTATNDHRGSAPKNLSVAGVTQSTATAGDGLAPPWYVCLTKPRGEAQAQLHLSEQGYEVYLPRLCLWRRSRGQWVRREQAMFPRYLFLRLGHASHGLSPVRSTPGVSSLVRFGERPATLDHATVLAIRDVEQQRRSFIDQQSTPFRAGDCVIISEGPLRGLQGIVSAVASERVAVLMSLLGRDQTLNLPMHCLQHAP